MNTIRSTEFRRQYAALSEPTVVTVLGRPIGTWTPGPEHHGHVFHWSDVKAERQGGPPARCYICGESPDRAEVDPTEPLIDQRDSLHDENERLAEEVRRLKQELAKRPLEPDTERAIGALKAAGVSPLPSTEEWQNLEAVQRRARQATIDATLGKVNRTKKGA